MKYYVFLPLAFLLSSCSKPQTIDELVQHLKTLKSPLQLQEWVEGNYHQDHLAGMTKNQTLWHTATFCQSKVTGKPFDRLLGVIKKSESYSLSAATDKEKYMDRFEFKVVPSHILNFKNEDGLNTGLPLILENNKWSTVSSVPSSDEFIASMLETFKKNSIGKEDRHCFKI